VNSTTPARPHSPVEHRIDDQLAEARNVNTVSVRTVPPSRSRSRARPGVHRDQGVPERVLQDHHALGEAFGARGAHVIGAQHLQHRAARVAHEHRGEGVPSTNAGMIIAARFAFRSSSGLT